MEEIMKRYFYWVIVCLLAGGVAAPAAEASATPQSNRFQPATILSVHKQEVGEPAYTGGDNPSDAPLQSEVYAYDVALRTVCGTYVAHFESPYDFLPAAFAPDHQLPVRIGKYDVSFDLGYREMRMNLVHRKADKGADCRSGQVRN
jgi:hypothetical protein